MSAHRDRFGTWFCDTCGANLGNGVSSSAYCTHGTDDTPCPICGGHCEACCDGDGYTLVKCEKCNYCVYADCHADIYEKVGRLELRENTEGIWLHVKTPKSLGAVLLDIKGPIVLATLRAVINE